MSDFFVRRRGGNTQYADVEFGSLLAAAEYAKRAFNQSKSPWDQPVLYAKGLAFVPLYLGFERVESLDELRFARVYELDEADDPKLLTAAATAGE